MSASFQRSAPSTMTNRRPIANVIALSAAAAASGVASSPSSTSAPLAPDSVLGHRAQLRPPLGERGRGRRRG